MQEQKLPVGSQSLNPLLLAHKKEQALSTSNHKKRNFLKRLGFGLIVSISSLGATVFLHQPAQAKATILDNKGRALIAELPSLDTRTIQSIQSNQKSVLIGDADTSKKETTSTILIKSDLVRETTTEGIPQLPSLKLAKIATQEASQRIHTVRAGDTVTEIARQYGISSNQIIEANQLTNPNFLQINYQLVIPSLELAQEHNYQRIEFSGDLAKQASEADREVPRLRQDRNFSLSNNFANSSSTKPASLSSLAEKKAESGSKKQNLESSINPNPLEKAEQTPNNNASQDSDSYISRLRQDIIQLRTRYQDQNSSNETTAVVRPTESNEQAVSKVDSETNTSVLTNISEENKQVSNNTEPQNPSLASAPTPAENFNTVIGTSGNDTIAPDLPPLDSPEEHFPDNPVFDGYMWPAQGTLTSGWGWRWGRMHKGIDIAAPIGTPIMAAAPGEVIFAGWNSGGYGNLVKLRHSDGSVTLYAHNNRVLVNSGQRVTQGQLIAEMGTTGRSTGPHLHFEIRPNGSTAINPMALLPQTR